MMKPPVILVVSSFLLLGGCATIMHGTYQKIEVASSPVGARVWVDSSEVGITPVSVSVKRNNDHLITVSLSFAG